MNRSIAVRIVQAYHQALARLITVAERLSEEELTTPPQPGAQPIAFHLWHIARWADHLQAALPGMTTTLDHRLGPGQEVWEMEQMAVRWGFAAETLGHAETGMGMRDDQSAALPWPSKRALLDYTKAVFRLAERATRAVDDELFLSAEAPQPRTAGIWVTGSTVGDALLTHLTHTNRHLGMIECLAGLFTGSGTATI
ncbi:MAG TPA: DinB family protein [Caldilineaceae bacterium]|nr:DinB family protein [Caldilineaceae bacterium]